MNPRDGVTIIGVLLISYLVGSIPFGVIFSRWIAGVDPRNSGSGNIGFTNVLRTAGRGPAVLTLLGDLSKGYLAVRSSMYFSMQEPWIWLAGISAVFGHLYPVSLGFKGGKGVATGLGVIYGIQPLFGWVTVAIWGLAVWLWRYSSLGAILAFGLLPLWVLWFRPVPETVVFSVILSGMILLKHRSNIHRLRSGTEPKIGRS